MVVQAVRVETVSMQIREKIQGKTAPTAENFLECSEKAHFSRLFWPEGKAQDQGIVGPLSGKLSRDIGKHFSRLGTSNHIRRANVLPLKGRSSEPYHS